MIINKEDSIKNSVLKNLLSAQERIVNEGSTIENIKIAKYLFKISKEFRNKEEYIFSEKSENGTYCPPNESN